MSKAPLSLTNNGNSPPTINNDYMIDYINMQYSSYSFPDLKKPKLDDFYSKLLKFLKLLLSNFGSGMDYLSSEFKDLFNSLFINDVKKKYNEDINYNLLDSNYNTPPIYNRNQFLQNS